MIKITKPGQKEFHGFCKWCGCEFTYEISDLKLSATSDKLSCPTCGKDYYHPSMVQDPTIPGGIGYGRLQDITWPPDPIPCTPDMTKTDPCAGCAWRENLLRDGLYVGDTPCTWCNNNKFNSITCSTSPLTGTVKGVSKLETHLTPCVDCVDDKCTLSGSDWEVGSTYTINNYVNECTSKPELDKKLQEVYDTTGVRADDITQGTVMTTILNACHDCTSNINKCDDTEGRNSCSGEHKCGSKKNCKGSH